MAVTVLYQPAPLFAAAAKTSLLSSVIPVPASSALMAARSLAFPEAVLMFSLMKDSSFWSYGFINQVCHGIVGKA
jgi:hypothetical protein